LLGALEPYVLARAKTDRWPGTELLGTEAERIDFRLEVGSAQILKSATDHLFGWEQPDLPEDLCLLREDGTPWLVTIAHEGDGTFLLTEEELRQLLEAIPDLPINLLGGVDRETVESRRNRRILPSRLPLCWGKAPGRAPRSFQN
jgi:hypothetical protein